MGKSLGKIFEGVKMTYDPDQLEALNKEKAEDEEREKWRKKKIR